MNSDNRNSTRKRIHCQALIAFPGIPPMRARTLDVSPGGLSVMMAEPMKAGETCAVAFEPLLNGKPVRIAGNARVAYSILSGADGFRIGLQFVQLDDANKKNLADLMG